MLPNVQHRVPFTPIVGGRDAFMSSLRPSNRKQRGPNGCQSTKWNSSPHLNRDKCRIPEIIIHPTGTKGCHLKNISLEHTQARSACHITVHGTTIALDPNSSFIAEWLPKTASILATGLVLLGTHNALASEKGSVIVGEPRVVDGDTLVVGGEKIRLFGLDAPETKQSCNDKKGHAYLCGKESGDALRSKIGKAAVQCQVKAKDLYGRNVASCSLPGTGDLGDWLVKEGHAVAYREYAKVYVEDENEAKRDHKGIWQGDFQKPADWRKENKAKGGSKSSNNSEPTDADFGSIFTNVANFFQSSSPGKEQASKGCEIKGNISSNNQKIYHVPGGRYYEGVKIEPQKGEAFFCSENDAQSAGFRKAKD